MACPPLLQCGIVRERQTRGGNAMNWIDVNGTALRYELSGSGKTTLVLVHEMGGSPRTGSETWAHMSTRGSSSQP